MTDTELVSTPLQKRHRNLLVFSMAIMIIGWAPTDMQSSFLFLGIQFKNINPAYMWGWALAINSYLFLAWVYTSRAEDQWLYLNGEKFRSLYLNKDFFWLRFFVCREYERHSFKRSLFKMGDEPEYIRKYVKKYEMVSKNKAYSKIRKWSEGQVFVSQEQFKKDFFFPSRSKGRMFCIYEGRHQRKPFYLVSEYNSSARGKPDQIVRQTLAELYFSIFPAIVLGCLGIGTAFSNLIKAS